MRASEKVQLSLTGSRQCAFYRATDEPCALPLSPLKGGSKSRIFTYFCAAFHIFVANNRRHFKFGVQIDHTKFLLQPDWNRWNGSGRTAVIFWFCSVTCFGTLNVCFEVCNIICRYVKVTIYNYLFAVSYGCNGQTANQLQH